MKFTFIYERKLENFEGKFSKTENKFYYIRVDLNPQKHVLAGMLCTHILFAM